MKKRPYTGAHLAARTATVKEIWQREAVAAIHRKSTPPTALAISYMVGFYTGMHAPHWWLGLFGAATYLIFYYLWRLALKAWQLLPEKS